MILFNYWARKKSIKTIMDLSHQRQIRRKTLFINRGAILHSIGGIKREEIRGRLKTSQKRASQKTEDLKRLEALKIREIKHPDTSSNLKVFEYQASI